MRFTRRRSSSALPRRSPPLPRRISGALFPPTVPAPITVGAATNSFSAALSRADACSALSQLLPSTAPTTLARVAGFRRLRSTNFPRRLRPGSAAARPICGPFSPTSAAPPIRPSASSVEPRSRERVSSRAAQTARDLSGGQSLPRYVTRIPSSEASAFAEARFAVGRSLAVFAARDDGRFYFDPQHARLNALRRRELDR